MQHPKHVCSKSRKPCDLPENCCGWFGHPMPDSANNGGGNTEQTQSVPHLKDLVLVRAVEWYDLGLQLGVENTELKVIQQNNPGDLRPCRREMFEAWLRITPNPSYQWLVEALLAVGETNEADRLCKKYGIEPQHSEFGEDPPTKKRRAD